MVLDIPSNPELWLNQLYVLPKSLANEGHDTTNILQQISNAQASYHSTLSLTSDTQQHNLVNNNVSFDVQTYLYGNSIPLPITMETGKFSDVNDISTEC